MIARYDLSWQIAGFDYFYWLLWVQSMGATEIVIDDRRCKTLKWDAAITRRRVETLIKPGAALAGLKCRTGSDGRMHKGYLDALLSAARRGRKIWRLRSVLPPGPHRYTVTLRNTQRAPHRNSNEQAWRTFAAEIGAYVIEDYDTMPLGLHELMALYAGAEMNFGVNNGPVSMCLLSEYPMMAFDYPKSAAAIERHCGLKFGEQLPWATPQQFMVWEPDDLDVILRNFEEWRANVPASAHLVA